MEEGNISHYISFCIIEFFPMFKYYFLKTNKAKINMNTNCYLVNYEKYFLFLEFVFSDIPKLPYQSKGQS